MLQRERNMHLANVNILYYTNKRRYVLCWQRQVTTFNYTVLHTTYCVQRCW